MIGHMAREMNIEKRANALVRIVTKTQGYSAKAAKIASELTNSFKGDSSPKGRRAANVAKAALKLSAALKKVG